MMGPRDPKSAGFPGTGSLVSMDAGGKRCFARVRLFACSVVWTSGGIAAASRRRKATALKLTLDSSEPLEDAMRVVGALYGVTLVLPTDDQDASTPARKQASKTTTSKRTARRKPSAAKATRPVAPASDVDAAQTKQRTARVSAGSPSNADIRSWARENGLTVSDRGRVPASVATAYRNAQTD